jgi:hypothetical protein
MEVLIKIVRRNVHAKTVENVPKMDYVFVNQDIKGFIVKVNVNLVLMG